MGNLKINSLGLGRDFNIVVASRHHFWVVLGWMGWLWVRTYKEARREEGGEGWKLPSDPYEPLVWRPNSVLVHHMVHAWGSVSSICNKMTENPGFSSKKGDSLQIIPPRLLQNITALWFSCSPPAYLNEMVCDQHPFPPSLFFIYAYFD